MTKTVLVWVKAFVRNLGLLQRTESKSQVAKLASLIVAAVVWFGLVGWLIVLRYVFVSSF